MRILILLFTLSLFSFTASGPKVGDIIDSYNGVDVHFNGKVFNVQGRNVASDGYNLGLRYQCVEFAKRYYYQHYNHRMPNTYGHAKDFFDESLGDVGFNTARGLIQFRNTRRYMPETGDLIIYGPTKKNPYGHMGIITWVGVDQVEMIQQNWGKKTRRTLKLAEYQGIYTIADWELVGWLRMPASQ